MRAKPTHKEDLSPRPLTPLDWEILDPFIKQKGIPHRARNLLEALMRGGNEPCNVAEFDLDGRYAHVAALNRILRSAGENGYYVGHVEDGKNWPDSRLRVFARKNR